MVRRRHISDGGSYIDDGCHGGELVIEEKVARMKLVNAVPLYLCTAQTQSRQTLNNLSHRLARFRGSALNVNLRRQRMEIEFQ